MAGADSSAVRGITNLLPVAQVMRWNWKMFQRQPILVVSVVLSAGGGLRPDRHRLQHPPFLLAVALSAPPVSPPHGHSITPSPFLRPLACRDGVIVVFRDWLQSFTFGSLFPTPSLLPRVPAPGCLLVAASSQNEGIMNTNDQGEFKRIIPRGYPSIPPSLKNIVLFHR